MRTYQIIILALIQGAAELLPVSSSAHVIAAEKLMRLDPTAPDLTFLLIMLHTGTMFAVMLYFGSRWRKLLTGSSASARRFLTLLTVATALTGVIGLGLKETIERIFLRGKPHAEIELLFGNIPLIAFALFVTGILIVWAGLQEKRKKGNGLSYYDSAVIGAVQGVCLPFRGLSRSGTTISTGMLLGADKVLVEDFSFALAVILTPPIIGREFLRLMHAGQAKGLVMSFHSFLPGLLGMGLSFVAGLAALRWLSSWLEKGRWRIFGYYCFCASLFLLIAHSITSR